MADNDFNISPEMINNLMGMLKDNSNSDSADDSTCSEGSAIDFDTIMKIKSIMETLDTKNDPRSNLLYSLKPYLRKSRQSKLDQYANLLKITKVTGLFNNESKKGDTK